MECKKDGGVLRFQDLPLDIISSVTSWLDGNHLYLLYFCGSSQLNTKLLHGGVETFYLNFRSLRSPLTFPSFALNIHQLRELYLTVGNDLVAPFVSCGELGQLNATLSKLCLSFVNDFFAFVRTLQCHHCLNSPFSNLDRLDLNFDGSHGAGNAGSKCFQIKPSFCRCVWPNLKHLSFGGYYYLTSSISRKLPRSLETLHFTESFDMDFQRSLPSGVTYQALEFLPSSIKSLKCTLEENHSADDYISVSTDRKDSAVSFAAPSSMVDFTIFPDLKTLSFNYHHDLDFKFPESVEHLQLHHHMFPADDPKFDLTCLPPHLTHFHYTGKRLFDIEERIHYFPKSLEYLNICVENVNDGKVLTSHLPNLKIVTFSHVFSNTEHNELASWMVDHYPSSLQQWPVTAIPVPLLGKLPPQLTTLTLQTLTSLDYFSSLPPSMTSINIHLLDIPSTSIATSGSVSTINLPPFLKSFHLSQCPSVLSQSLRFSSIPQTLECFTSCGDAFFWTPQDYFQIPHSIRQLKLGWGSNTRVFNEIIASKSFIRPYLSLLLTNIDRIAGQNLATRTMNALSTCFPTIETLVLYFVPSMSSSMVSTLPSTLTSVYLRSIIDLESTLFSKLPSSIVSISLTVRKPPDDSEAVLHHLPNSLVRLSVYDGMWNLPPITEDVIPFLPPSLSSFFWESRGGTIGSWFQRWCENRELVLAKKHGILDLNGRIKKTLD